MKCTTVLSQGNSLFRYASHSNLPTSSSELSSVTVRVGPASRSKVKPGQLPPVSVATVEHVDCSWCHPLPLCHGTAFFRHGGMVVCGNNGCN